MRSPAVLLTVIGGLLALTALTGPSGGGAVSAEPSPASASRALTEPTGATLLLLRDGAAARVEVDRRRVETVTIPGLPRGEPRSVVARRGTVVVQVGRGAYAVPRSLAGKAVALGPADAMIAGASDDRVWLVTYPAPSVSRAREVRVDGVETAPGHETPPAIETAAVDVTGGAVILAAVDRGLVVATRPDVAGRRALEVHDPGDGRVVLSVTRDGILLAARHDRVVWRAPGCRHCPVEMTDVRTGTRRGLRGAVAGGATVYAGSFSPGGRTLALFASSTDGAGVQVVLVDVARDRVTSSEVGSTAPAAATVDWSSSGRWLFFATGDGLEAVRRDGAGRTLDIALPAISALVAG